MTTPPKPESRDASFVVRWTDYTGKRQQTARTDRDHAYKLAATLPHSVVVHVGLRNPK
jgi:hypothetical protein